MFTVAIDATAPDKTPDRIAGMFDAIAPRYDLLNHLLSAGIDRRWRTRMIASLQLTGRETLIDVCTGTADVALEARRGGSAGARNGGPRARRRLRWSDAGPGSGEDREARASSSTSRSSAATRCGSPLLTAVADAATVAFGIRNVQKTDVACRELARVLGQADAWRSSSSACRAFPGLAALYRWYFSRVLPFIGRAISGHSGAYSYLPASVGAFRLRLSS